MKDKIRISLEPLGKTIEANPNSRLQDVLFPHGIEFPCGGRGRCKGCRVKVLKGSLPTTQADEKLLSPQELNEGWRLSCQNTVTSDLSLELAQWETSILSDETSFEFIPKKGLGVAIDLGSTTLVAQLLDLQNGCVLAVQSALNPQARHGADLMSRVSFSLKAEGRKILGDLIRDQLGTMISNLSASARVNETEILKVVIVGNSVMHHLFCGIDLDPLSHYPFELKNGGLQKFEGPVLGWKCTNAEILFLPCLGSFVGSDILAGILATSLHENHELTALVDLGTNGEIVLGNHKRILCTSTAAGPAFEGAQISMGMRASTGAVSEVFLNDGGFQCRVLGGGSPRGICGSGLVDAAAVGLDLGFVQSSGRLVQTHNPMKLIDPVEVTQTDIRQLQLAKGAIAAGIRILLQSWGAEPSSLKQIYLAGAFGNYINFSSARRIGLINFPIEKILPAGNTALKGAKLALFADHHENGSYSHILAKVSHLSLNEDPHFQDIYVEEMSF